MDPLARRLAEPGPASSAAANAGLDLREDAAPEAEAITAGARSAAAS